MPKRKASKLDVDAVLAGRVRPSAGELLELIHRENPTGRELDAREVARRYARKARLQSLLVRRFADELDVSQDASSPGTASLRHRGQGRDGCHAVVATLDEDARAWVQRQLDLAAQDTPDAEPPVARSNSRPAVGSSEGTVENATLEGLLRQASTALKEYDYPGAQSALEQALEASGGAAGPASALLEVLVDTLGDDAGALGLEPMLGNGALSDARVRGLLALAAARSSLEDRALSMVRGVGDEQAATVYAALAASALRAGDADRAARYLEQANRCDASCMSIRGIAEELDRARAAARGPAESELMALMAAGRAAEAEKLASEVAARWPESEVARRVRRELEECRRNEGIARRVAEAEQALAQGDAVTALARLGQAAAAAEGAEREAIERRASDIEAAERERRATDQVEQVLAMLQGSDPTDGLERYAGLEDALRRRVRALSARAELDWLDRMAIARGTDRAKVAAAIAVEGARTALPRSPEAALELLAPHQTILERVPEARRIQSAAEGAVRAAKLEEMRAKIGKARAALAAGEASDALATLEAVTLRELPEDDRAEVAVIHASATRVVDRQRRAEESVRLRAAGRLFEARTLAEGLAAGAGDADERERWERERSEIQADIQREFRVAVDQEARAAEELGRFRPRAAVGETPWLLTADGSGILIVRAYERWVVLRLLDCATLQITVTVLLRTPEPLGWVHATVCGSAVWLLGDGGAIVELSIGGWEVRDFRPSAEVASPTDIVDTAVIATGKDSSDATHFWVACRSKGTTIAERVRVIDLGRRQVVRELQGIWLIAPVAGLDTPGVVVTKDRVSTLHSPRGAVIPPGRLDLRFGVREMAVHPSGKGLVAVVSEPWSERAGPDASDEQSVYVATISPDGKLDAIARLPDADPDRPSSVAVARGSECIHVLSKGDGDAVVSCLTPTEDRRLETVYSVVVNSETILVQDAAARRVMALSAHDSGVDAVELGRTAPVLPQRPPRPEIVLPGEDDVHDCSRSSAERNAVALALAASWRDCSDSEILRRGRDLEQAPTTTPEQLIELVFALGKEYSEARQQTAKHIVQRLFARFPNHPEVRLLVANDHAAAGRWPETREALAGVDANKLDPRQAQHLHHLLALAAAREGRLRDLRQHVTAALTFDGDCDLESLSDLAEPIAESAVEARAGWSGLRRLIDAIATADACLASGDYAAALKALDVPVVWFGHDGQSLARLAEAHLALETDTPAARLRKLEALGVLLDHLDRPNISDRGDVPVQGAWDAERIADVASRARAWLDAQGSRQGT